MNISASIQREIYSLTAWMFFMLVLGFVFDILGIMIFVGMLVYIAWHLYNLNRLVQWLHKPSKNTPESIGIWDDAFFQLHSQHKRQIKSRKKLAKMLKRFQRSTKALPYATIVLNSNNEIEWFNPASKSLFGLRSALDVGQRIDNLIRQPKFIKYLNVNDFSNPLEFDHQYKKILLNITGYGKGQHILSARDITLRTKQDEMRRDFISNASHELRTPITVMSGYIESLKKSVDEKNRYPIDKIFQQTIRMEKIISELMALAKLETSVAVDLNEPIDSTELLNEVYNEALAFDNGKHNISLDIEKIDISGSYEEIRTVISNLLTNAIRYTPEGGEIKLSTSIENSSYCIHVEDNGNGIAYEHITRLTERFYRVDEGRSRQKGGTGLGLAIVKQILDRHGASLKVKSELDKGSVFSCYFPFNNL